MLSVSHVKLSNERSLTLYDSVFLRNGDLPRSSMAITISISDPVVERFRKVEGEVGVVLGDRAHCYVQKER